MGLNKNHITLINRYLNRDADNNELTVFFKLVSEGKLDGELRSQMDKDLDESSDNMKPAKKRHVVLIRAAAIVLLVLTAISLLYFQKNDTYRLSYKGIVPGQNKVVLVLSDGKEVSVAENVNKTIIEGNIEITINEEGNIIYGKHNKDKSKKTRPERLNSIKTAVGGTIRVQLTDGSLVWLNSLSSITFPLNSESRTISMEGEAFYNIAHLDSIPFVVKHNIQEINVFGTKFNVNAYEDENTFITTLLEGSISVKTATDLVTLVPGEQSIIKSGSDQIKVSTIDLDDNNVIDWTEGYIRFNRTDLRTLVRQISRWHDLNVVFSNVSGEDEFTGRIGRSEKIEHVINILNQGGIQIRLEGKTLYVGN